MTSLKSLSKFRFSLAAVLLTAFVLLPLGAAEAQTDHGADPEKSIPSGIAESAKGLTGEEAAGTHGGVVDHDQAHDAEHGDEHHAEGHAEGHDAPGTFDPHGGTLVNPIARLLWGTGPVEVTEHDGVEHFSNIEYDFITIAILMMALIGVMGVLAARKVALRPTGKPMSLANIVETAADGFRNYLIGVMGESLGMKYAPLISSFFFTILFFNWLGLVPGMMAPTANPNVPIALALIAFVSIHVIAIRETGIKSWFMHFVGEPVWLAPLNFPLHLLGELIKPLSLSIRLLCNVFGEEMVVLQLILISIGAMALLQVPIPFQLPMLLLGTFLGLLQALVFSTLLAIYISVMSTHHDEHDEHNAHGSTEHVDVHDFKEVVAHPTQSPVA